MSSEAIPKPSEETSVDLLLFRKIYFSGARWMKSAAVSLSVIVFPSSPFVSVKERPRET